MTSPLDATATAFGGAPLAPSTRGFAPPSVSQRCSTSICYLFENYCNLLLQFAFYFLCRRFAAVLRSKIEVGDFEAVKLVSLKIYFQTFIQQAHGRTYCRRRLRAHSSRAGARFSEAGRDGILPVTAQLVFSF